jgi:heptosyltransferase-1
VDMQGTLRSGVIGWMAGVKTLAGYSDPRERAAGWFYTRRLKRTGAHVVEQGAALLGDAAGVRLEPIAAPLPRDTEAEMWAEQNVRSRPLLMLAPGGGWGSKRWPAERFAAVARALQHRMNDCVVNASSDADALALQVAHASDGTARALSCSVAQLLALMRRTDLFVGGDSGPLHLAAALGVPATALFGPTDPARNGPWGPGTKIVLRDPSSSTSYKRGTQTDAGLAKITVEQVVAAMEQLI